MWVSGFFTLNFCNPAILGEMTNLHVNRLCLLPLYPLPFTLSPLSISLTYHHNCWRADELFRLESYCLFAHFRKVRGIKTLRGKG
jgi:hypothetical protein